MPSFYIVAYYADCRFYSSFYRAHTLLG